MNDVEKEDNKRVVLYTAHCQKCDILERKLQAKGIKYETNEDIEEMLARGFQTAPMLEVDGEVYDFGKAIKWVNSFGG